jgi:hypothetical protein
MALPGLQHEIQQISREVSALLSRERREGVARMKVGTKSILFGGHCFLLHGFFVAWAWKRLYGWPMRFRLWVAFFVHDLGYWGKTAMDDEEGQKHPELGGRIMGRLFGREWELFTLCHSRHYADLNGLPVSRLCVADKLAVTLTPAWLYLLLVRASGEIEEYLQNWENAIAQNNSRVKLHHRAHSDLPREIAWQRGLFSYFRAWVKQHHEGGEDTWKATYSYQAKTTDMDRTIRLR